jgi:hypothetical protein
MRGVFYRCRSAAARMRPGQAAGVADTLTRSIRTGALSWSCARRNGQGCRAARLDRSWSCPEIRAAATVGTLLVQRASVPA